MQSPYIPATDSGFDSWLANFSGLITATPADFGLTAPDAVIIANAYTAWNAAFLTATNPATRTSPAIAAKDAERLLAEQVVRPYAISISRNPAVTNLDKTAVGVNLPNSARTPIPPPLTVPGLTLVGAIHFVHTLAFRDTSTPTTKAKPFGAIGMELWRTLAVGPSADPATATQIGVLTKSPNTIGYTSPDVGKTATYWGRWITRSGPGGTAQVGPFSAALAVLVI
jgi:hypothetical protein